MAVSVHLMKIVINYMNSIKCIFIQTYNIVGVFFISERIFTCGNKEFGILFVNKAKLILNKMQTISTLLILRKISLKIKY